MSTAGLIVPAVPAGRPLPHNATVGWMRVRCITEGATVSGAGALLVIGVAALALALGVLVVVLRRIPARLPAAATPNAGLLAEQAQADAEQVRVRAQAEADKILSHATEAAEHLVALTVNQINARTTFGIVPISDAEVERIITGGVAAFVRAYRPPAER